MKNKKKQFSSDILEVGKSFNKIDQDVYYGRKQVEI